VAHLISASVAHGLPFLPIPASPALFKVFTGRGLGRSSRPVWKIARLGLGSRWLPNSRQFSPVLDHLPQGGIYRCQRSQATRGASPRHCLPQWKHERRLINGIDCVNGFGFLISLYSYDFHYLIFVIISMYLVDFGELGNIVCSDDQYRWLLVSQFLLSNVSIP